jgi:hypothetical protein
LGCGTAHCHAAALLLATAALQVKTTVRAVQRLLLVEAHDCWHVLVKHQQVLLLLLPCCAETRPVVQELMLVLQAQLQQQLAALLLQGLQELNC